MARMRLLRSNRPGAKTSREPVAALGLGDPPERLSPAALECWREIERELLAVNCGTRLDRWAVELLADCLAEYRTLATRTDEKWQPLRLSAFKRTARLLTELGLTPNTRSRLLVPHTRDDADPFERFLSKRPEASPARPTPTRRRLCAKKRRDSSATHTDIATGTGTFHERGEQP